MNSDVLIIGGGVIGASIAYHLALERLTGITVIDKAPKAAAGSTGKATGGFRAQFGSEINIKLSLLAQQKLLSFKDELGVDPCFQQYGYLFLAQNENEMKLLEQANKLQKSCGLKEAEIVSPDYIMKLNPHIQHEGISGGAFCLSDGFISPLKILEGYTEGAERRGVNFKYGTELNGFTIENNCIKSARTASGNINIGIVINAAGAWAGEIAKLAGIDIPVKPLKRQAALVKEKNIFPDSLPMTIWIDNKFHFRIRNGNMVMLLPVQPEINEPFNIDVENSWLEKILNIAKQRIPALQNCSIDKENSIAGLYEISPDEHVLLGLAPGLENLYLANGSSGHGVMHSPALGQLISELITGKKPSVDVNTLNPSRFNEGKFIESIPFF